MQKEKKPLGKKTKRVKSGRTPRLFSRATFVGYTRGRHVQTNAGALLEIEGCRTRDDAKFYVGKKTALVYKVKNAATGGKKLRIVWGRVRAAHGNSGVVRAKFRKDLTGNVLGGEVRVLLYPSLV